MAYKTGWMKKIINGVSTKVFAFAHAKTVYVDYANGKTLDTALDEKAQKREAEFITSVSMGKKDGTFLGLNSTALGNYVTASGNNSHAEGLATTASGNSSHAEGSSTTASFFSSHAEGNSTTASGDSSHAEGNSTTASGSNSHAEGSGTTASGNNSHAEGNSTTALAYQHAGGHYNNTTVATDSKSLGTGSGTSFVVGNGTPSAKSNAFRVNDNGQPFGQQGYTTQGCDYAEYYEWLDKNTDEEDRRGYFVTLDGEKIKIANPGDFVLGIVSAWPSIIGNGDEDWLGRYILDDFGSRIAETFEYEIEEKEEITNEDGEKEIVTKKVKKTGTHWKQNPNYDPNKPYTQRSERPEWDAIGMLGVLAVRDDGTCQVNGFCTLADGGIATASDKGYRVVKRVTDNIVKVIFNVYA